MTTSKPANLLLKLFTCFVVTYLGIAYGFYTFSQRDYVPLHNSWVIEQYNILLAPVSEIFANGKISHAWDWETVSRNSISKSIESLKLSSNSQQYRDYETFSYKDIVASLGKVTEAAIVSPANYSGNWSIVYCIQFSDFCQKSLYSAPNMQKIMLDGKVELWGLAEDGSYIQLNLVKFTQTNKDLGVNYF